jgi:hypothetical protein
MILDLKNCHDDKLRFTESPKVTNFDNLLPSASDDHTQNSETIFCRRLQPTESRLNILGALAPTQITKGDRRM